MLHVTVQNLEDARILHLEGRVVFGEEYSVLRNAVIRQPHSEILALDLSQVDRIDAGGLGVLLRLREWACSEGIILKLMNPMNIVKQVFELTRLDRVFEFCSAAGLSRHANRGAARTADALNTGARSVESRRRKARCHSAAKAQEPVNTTERLCCAHT